MYLLKKGAAYSRRKISFIVMEILNRIFAVIVRVLIVNWRKLVDVGQTH